MKLKDKKEMGEYEKKLLEIRLKLKYLIEPQNRWAKKFTQ